MPNITHTPFRRAQQRSRLRRGATVETVEPAHPAREHDRPDCELYHAHLDLVSRGKPVVLSSGAWKSTHSVCPAGCPDYVQQEPEGAVVLSSNAGWEE